MGRFIARDPIGEKGGINLFEFLGNAPINKIDLFGLTDNCEAGSLGKMRGDVLNTVISIGGLSPDDSKLYKALLVGIPMIADIPMSIEDIIISLFVEKPSGSDVSAEMAALALNWDKFLRINMGTVSIWSKVQCEKCVCSGWLATKLLYGGNKIYDWKHSGKEKWVKCDISQTKKSTQFPNNKSEFVVGSLSDAQKILSQMKSSCEEQAKKACAK